jgi:hypothetical protein
VKRPAATGRPPIDDHLIVGRNWGPAPNTAKPENRRKAGDRPCGDVFGRPGGGGGAAPPIVCSTGRNETVAGRLMRETLCREPDVPPPFVEAHVIRGEAAGRETPVLKIELP